MQKGGKRLRDKLKTLSTNEFAVQKKLGPNGKSNNAVAISSKKRTDRRKKGGLSEIGEAEQKLEKVDVDVVPGEPP